jgi:hypothetical protein
MSGVHRDLCRFVGIHIEMGSTTGNDGIQEIRATCSGASMYATIWRTIFKIIFKEAKTRRLIKSGGRRQTLTCEILLQEIKVAHPQVVDYND